MRGQGHGKYGCGSYLLPISEGVQVCRTVCVNGYCGAYLVISWTSAHLHCGIELCLIIVAMPFVVQDEGVWHRPLHKGAISDGVDNGVSGS